ncbi:hypothetical protein Ancab_034662 [Ancistrocladus abbreviatus]
MLILGRFRTTFCLGLALARPHAAAAAVDVKSFHLIPNWSPAAIRSVLVTTAGLPTTTNPDAEFAQGAGHINPLKAVAHGWVYNTGEVN